MQYTYIFFSFIIDNFVGENDTLNVVVQNIHRGYTLEPAVLTSTHNLCFGSKIRKKCIPQFTI